MNKAQRDIRRKKRVLEHAARIGNVRKTCRYFGVARSGFYVWKKAYEMQGDEGLVNQKPCPYNPRLRTPPDIVEKVLHLRRTYHLGPIRIVWYLARYHGITISKAGVYRILRRHGINRLPSRVGRRTVHTHRYAKQVPGHHVQVDVTFLKLLGKNGVNSGGRCNMSQGWRSHGATTWPAFDGGTTGGSVAPVATRGITNGHRPRAGPDSQDGALRGGRGGRHSPGTPAARPPGPDPVRARGDLPRRGPRSVPAADQPGAGARPLDGESGSAASRRPAPVSGRGR